MDFDAAVAILLSPLDEGGYSNNSRDPGGETMWGITQRVAYANGYTGDMHLLPRETAEAIYRKKYWDPLLLDQMPEVLRFPAFDAGVNSGVPQSAMWMQQALGQAQNGKIDDLDVSAASLLVNPYTVACEMVSLRIDFLTSLPTWGGFGKGWMRRIALVLDTIANIKGANV